MAALVSTSAALNFFFPSQILISYPLLSVSSISPSPTDLWYPFLLLILSYYVSLSSSLTDHPSLQMTSIQRHQRNGERNRKKKTMRKTAWELLASVKNSSVLTEGVVEDDRKNDTPPFPDWKKEFGPNGPTYTLAQTLMHRYSNVDRKTVCCQDRVFIYCFPSVTVYAP